MLPWLAAIVKYLPGIGTILDKVTGASDEAERIKAEIEKEDIEGFYKTGRVSANHLWKYTKVGIAILLAIVFCSAIFYPPATENIASLLENFLSLVDKLSDVGME